MVFKTATQSEYERGIKLRVLDTQISSLIRTVGYIEGRSWKGYPLSDAERDRLVEARNELKQRRARRAELTLPTDNLALDTYGNLRALDPRARHEQMRRTHVIVGDHTPEVRRTPIEPRTRTKADIQRELENGNSVEGWKLVRGTRRSA